MDYFKENIFNSDWVDQIKNQKVFCEGLKRKTQDPSDQIECIYTKKLSERVGTLLKDQGLVEVIDSCLPQSDRLTLVKTLIQKLTQYYTIPVEQKVQKILKVILAILTEGVVTAPIDGLIRVEVLEDRSLKIEVAGPIRAAGGTIMGMLVVMTEYLRKKFNFNKYVPTQKEIKRSVLEILSYVRAHPTQIRPSKEEVSFVLENCPIMIDAMESQLEEVPLHKYLPRIQKPRIRGGIALIVIEGIIIRAPKVLAFSEGLGLEESLGWLKDLHLMGKKFRKEGSRSTDVISKYSLSIGRPVISSNESLTGLRLRFGSTPTTGLSACNLHPLVLDLLGFINIGSQVIVSYPGKGATVSGTCEDLQKPKVRYHDGVRVYEMGTRDQVLQIIELGQILFGLGECIEYQKKVPIRDYCRGQWRHDTHYQVDIDSLTEETALLRYHEAKLAPRFALNLETLTFREYLDLKNNYLRQTGTFYDNPYHRSLLNKLGAEYDVVLEPQNLLRVRYPKILDHYLKEELDLRFDQYYNSTSDSYIRSKGGSALTEYLNIKLKQKGLLELPQKGYSVVYARVGRAEAIHIAKMKPKSSTSLAQLKKKTIESFWSYVQKHPFGSSDCTLRYCFSCKLKGIYKTCVSCGLKTSVCLQCEDCKVFCLKDSVEQFEHKTHKTRSTIRVLRNYLKQIEHLKDLKLKTYPLNEVKKEVPLKLKNSASTVRYPEDLVKGYLRSKHKLSVTKDGTIRLSHPNLPTTHFRPSECGTSLEFLHSIGYHVDHKGDPLKDPNQIVALNPTDIIISKTIYSHLKKIAGYLDQLLVYYYGFDKPFYSIKQPNDLLGHSFFSISPHTSSASINRIIGYTQNYGIYYHPLVIACRRRDADGDMDSGGLSLDLYLNMSPQYLDASKIGSLMGVPLSITYVYPLDNIGKEVLNKQLGDKFYPELNISNLKEYDPKDLKKVYRVQSLLEQGVLEPQADLFKFNTPGFSMNTHNTRNLYRDSQSNDIKVDLVLELEEKLKGVSQAQCIIGLIEGHIVPDMIGNSNAYFKQKLICNFCNLDYSTVPLSIKCPSCGLGSLKQTVYPQMVLKYYKLLLKLESRCVIPPYLQQKINQIKSTLKVFRSGEDSNALRALYGKS